MNLVYLLKNYRECPASEKIKRKKGVKKRESKMLKCWNGRDEFPPTN
jgi:hypothetical protein